MNRQEKRRRERENKKKIKTMIFGCSEYSLGREYKGMEDEIGRLIIDLKEGLSKSESGEIATELLLYFGDQKNPEVFHTQYLVDSDEESEALLTSLEILSKKKNAFVLFTAGEGWHNHKNQGESAQNINKRAANSTDALFVSAIDLNNISDRPARICPFLRTSDGIKFQDIS